MSNYSFVPKYFLIQSIAQGQQTTVTFTTDHDYVLSEYVSFRCGEPNGMVEINNQKAVVKALTNDSITVNIDSTNYTPFVFNLSVAILPVAVPVGSGVSYDNYVPTIILGDVFDNVSVN